MISRKRLYRFLAGALGSFVSVGVAAAAPSPIVQGETIGTPELVAAACKEGQVVFYTAQADADERAVTQDFQRDYPCIKVLIISAVTGRLFERMQAEAAAGKTQADAAIITDEALAQQLIDKGLLRQWTPPSAAQYPDSAKKLGWWYAASSNYLYPVYNTNLVSDAEAPKSWKDLLDPKWKGQIAAPIVTLGGTGWTQYYFFEKVLGEGYLHGFAAQQPRLFTSYAPMGLGAARGEFKISLAGLNVDYPLRVLQGAPIRPIYPTEGIPVVNYPIVLLSHSPHPNAGELFANWYLSKEGQSKLVAVRGVYSLRDDVAPAQGNPPKSQLHLWSPTFDQIQRDYTKLITTATHALGSQ